jgi:hypothetical protein
VAPDLLLVGAVEVSAAGQEDVEPAVAVTCATTSFENVASEGRISIGKPW